MRSNGDRYRGTLRGGRFCGENRRFCFAAKLTPGFYVDGFISGFFGAMVLSIINIVLRWITPGDSD